MELLQPAATLETLLSRHPVFGDDGYVRGQLQRCYEHQLERASRRLPAAGALLAGVQAADDDTRRRVLGDTAVRCSIQHALTQLEVGDERGLPLDGCEDVFRAAVVHLAAGRAEAPLHACARHVSYLQDGGDHISVWAEACPDDVFSRTFRYLVDENFGTSLSAPSDDDLDRLQRGARLLAALVPEMSRSALGHVQLVAVFDPVGSWKGRGSCSQFRVGGTIFLRRDLLRSPWWVAEHLLHEALHQKLYDFRRGHSLFTTDLPEGRPARVISLWNPDDGRGANCWDLFRSVAACHVYVHLAVLSALAESRAGELEPVYGPIRQRPAMTGSGAAFERAYYLSEQIAESCWDEMGTAGRRMMEWLSAVLDALNPSPPPRGAYLHLLLDLYEREADTADSALRKGSGRGEGPGRQLAGLIDEEVAEAQRILTMLAAQPALTELRDGLSRDPAETPGDRFRRTRHLIATALRRASPDGYTLRRSPSESHGPDEAVRAMVQRSSERLKVAFG